MDLEKLGFGDVAKIGKNLAQTGSSDEWVELGTYKETCQSPFNSHLIYQ